ncbi:Alpha/Beta hydrolase protein [Mycena capillaripes]|nr:Alpha/Beta hydrolase protein [Mycena capillaripes]
MTAPSRSCTFSPPRDQRPFALPQDRIYYDFVQRSPLEVLALPGLLDIPTARERFNPVIEAPKATYAPGLPSDVAYQLTAHRLGVVGGQILVRNLVPTSSDNVMYPLLVWIHGGGMVDRREFELDDYHLRAICVELRVSVLNVDYGCARSASIKSVFKSETPEHPHPTGLEYCYAALKWTASSPHLFHADLKKGFIIGGRRLHDRDGELTGQLLQALPVGNTSAVPEKWRFLLSYEQNKRGPSLTLECLFGADPVDPSVSPLLYPSHRRRLVPAVVQVCGLDPLRDEGLLYDRMLREAGVRTRTTTYAGVPHALQYSFPRFKIAIKWEEDFRAGLQWLLDGTPQ